MDLFKNYVPDSVGKIQPQPALFDLLGKPPKSPWCRLSHRTATYRLAGNPRGPIPRTAGAELTPGSQVGGCEDTASDDGSSTHASLDV